MQRPDLLLLFFALTACGPNDVRPRPNARGPYVRDAGVEDTESSQPSPNPSDGGASDTATMTDVSLDAGASDAGLETQAPVSKCDGLVCDVFAACVGGDEPQCICAPGLEGDGQRCSDVDECQLENAACGANSSCENSFGGFSCRCNPGYERLGDECVADDACSTSVCATNATCSNVDGQVSCTCDESSVGNGFFCTTTDPCAGSPCGPNGSCAVAAGAERDFVCACEPGFFGERSCSACGEELSLADPELERAVRQQLGLAPDELRPIRVVELYAYSSLDASKFEVTNLAGLECWPGLQVLDLSYNPGLTNESAQALSSLNQLTELRLDCTQVTDLRVLDGHPNLRALSLNVLNCDDPVLLEETSALGTLPQLQVLDVRGQKLTDAAVLSPLRNLRSLWFGYNQISAVGDLPDLPLLEELDVSYNQLRSVDDVARFSRLRYLNVSNNELESLTPTEELPALRTINASGNRVSSLPDWSDTDLVQIDVSFNQLAVLGPVVDLNRVAWVSVAGNDIATLAPLLEGSLRGTLVIAGNKATCAEPSVIADLRALGVDVQGECTQ